MKFRELIEKKRIIPKVPKELVDIIKDKEDAGDYWADFLDYNGRNLFKDYITFLGWFENNTRKLENATWTETQYEEMQDEDGNGYNDEWEEEITRHKQESYLGYIPSKNQFITGFDIWEGDDNLAGIVYWTLIKGKFKIISEDLDYTASMMYGRNGGYKKLHSKHKDLIDIRLD